MASNFTLNEENVILISMSVSCGLSLIGSAFIIITFILLSEQRMFFHRKLVFIMSICDFFTAAFYLITPFYNHNDVIKSGGVLYFKPKELCLFQAINLQFWQLSSFGWTVIICFNLYFTMLKNKDAEPFYPLYHLFVWSYNILVGVILYFEKAYGVADQWCWLDVNSYEWRLIAGYIPLWLVWIYSLLVYCRLVFHIRSVFADNEASFNVKADTKVLRKFLLIPFFFILLNFWGSINRVTEIATQMPQTNFWLVLLQAICDPLHGFVNGCFYGFFDRTVILMCRSKYGKNSSRIHSYSLIVDDIKDKT